jgi:tetratricopeptide (TPR) repeat protein
LALLSKETAILFPLVLITYDALFHRSTLKISTIITRYAPYAILLVVYFILRANALGAGEVTGELTNQLTKGGVWSRMNFQNWPMLLEFTAHYIQLLFFPAPLEYYYDAPSTSILALITGGILIFGALAYLPRAIQKEHKLYLLALAWVVCFLLPALPIALFQEPVFATRVLYLPSAGFALLMGWFVQHAQVLSNTVATTAKAIISVMLLSFTIATLVETDDWKNDTVFYTQAMKTNPDSFKPIAGLATAKERAGDTDYAIDLFLRAATLAPQKSEQLNFQENAARLYGQTGNTNKSEELYNEILRHDPKRSSSWVGLGNNALARGDSQQALNFYQKAYQADSRNFVASYNLMMIYQRLGKLQQAAYFRDISRKLQQANQ